MNLLLVDDQPRDLSFYSKTFSKRFNVYEASSVDESIKVYSNQKIDLVVSDVVMEEKDSGFKLLERIGEEVPVYIISGFDYSTKAAESKAFGFGLKTDSRLIFKDVCLISNYSK